MDIGTKQTRRDSLKFNTVLASEAEHHQPPSHANGLRFSRLRLKSKNLRRAAKDVGVGRTHRNGRVTLHLGRRDFALLHTAKRGVRSKE